jgi:large subunit ribosomal protein L25
LIHDLDVHSVTDELLHVDFLAVKADEKVEAEVPIVLVGESPVEKNNIGRVELVKDAVLVEAYPQDLPHEIKVDISKIQTPADVIHVSDLEVPEKVTIKENLEETVATVVEFESE